MQELDILQDRMIVQQAPGTDGLESNEGRRLFSAAFFVGIHGSEGVWGCKTILPLV